MLHQIRIIKGLTALYYCSNAVLLPYLPLYFASKGFTTVEIGMLMMTGPFVAIVAQPVWGYVSDRFQTVKWVLAFLWSAALAASFGMFYAEGFPLTLTYVTLLYFFLMPSQPLLDSLTIRAAAEAGISYGSVRMWGSIGFTVFAVLSGGLLALFGGVEGLRWIYWGLWAFPLGLLTLLRDTKLDAPPITLRSLSIVARNRTFLWFLFLVFIMMLPHRMNDSFLGLYMSSLGASEQIVGLAWAVATLGEALTFGLLYRYLHKVHELALLGIVGLLYVVRWIVYALVSDPMWLLALQVTHAITFAVFWAAAVAFAVRSVPPELRSTGQSVLSAVFIGLTGLAAGTLGGWLEEWGGYATLYQVGAVLAALGGTGFLLTHAARRGSRRQTQENS
ncbi:MFS transporter [Paenibacillus sp. TRM 82003]|nr:MFS transporter [Paenibacillus sp. TRM 82003]